jgi:hypothetical protein
VENELRGASRARLGGVVPLGEECGDPLGGEAAGGDELEELRRHWTDVRDPTLSVALVAYMSITGTLVPGAR